MKQSGLGDNLYVGGYDLSGDVGSLSSIGGGPAAIEVTGIDKSAFERLGGLRSGTIEFSAFFNDAAGQAHPALSTLSTSNRVVTYCRGTSLGSPSACLVAKQLNYDPSRSADGALTESVSAQSNGYGIEWGRLLTAGMRTDTGATSGTGVATDQTGTPFISLPGSSGNTATTPDAAGLDVVGDIDLAAKIAPNDWTPAADGYVISKYTVTGNQRSYALILTTTGNIAIQFSADGVTGVSKASTTNLSALADGSVKWIRATLDVDNGASGYDAKFYTSDDGVTWTQLGATVTTATATSIFASTAVLEIGSRNVGTSDFFAGKFFEGWVKNGLAGTAVARPIASVSALTDATPLTWTLNGTATASTQTAYGLQAYLQMGAFTGTDVTVKLQHSRDNSTWTDVTGGGFTAVTASRTTERIATTSALIIERYLRATTTTSGGFTSATFAVTAVRNEGTVAF